MSNPLLQGNRSPVMVLGAITGKAVMDYSLVTQFKENANNPYVSETCYPNGADDINHDIMPGFASFGQRNVRSVDDADGGNEATEVGIVSVAGLNWGSYCSQRQMEEDHYFQGIVTTEQRLTKPNDDVTDEPDTGYGTVRTGTISVPNNGPYTFYPGSLISVRFPPAPFHPSEKGGRKIFNGGDNINQLARAGEPITQFRPQYVPFDPTDFKVQLAAVYACVTQQKGDGNPDGISNMPYVNAVPHLMGDTGCRPWSCLQEEAISYKYGTWGIALTLIETLVRNGLLTVNAAPVAPNVPVRQSERDAHLAVANLAERVGLWSPDSAAQTLLFEGLADVFLKNISPLDSTGAEAVTRFRQATGLEYIEIARTTPQSTLEHYQSMRANVSELMLQGIASSIFSKSRSIIGFATNTAGPGDTLDTVIGHHRG